MALIPGGHVGIPAIHDHPARIRHLAEEGSFGGGSRRSGIHQVQAVERVCQVNPAAFDRQPELEAIRLPGSHLVGGGAVRDIQDAQPVDAIRHVQAAAADGHRERPTGRGGAASQGRSRRVADLTSLRAQAQASAR